MAGNQTVNTDLTKLNKKDLLKMYIYSQAFVSGFNYEKQEAPGFAFSMMPVIEKVYKNEEDKKEAYRRHTELFLTEARLSHFVIGVTAAMVSSYETDIRLPSYEVMVRLADLFGVTVDYLLCRQDRRFLDISDLSEEEAALVCGMVELLRKKDGKK